MDAPLDQDDVIVDPSADTIIILKHQATDFAVWDEAAEFPRPPLVLPDTHQDTGTTVDTDMKEQDPLDELFEEDPPPNPPEERETRFHVSSRHLSLASSYFHRTLSDKWDHHERDANGRAIIYEVGWSHPAFARLMYIIHGKARAVSRMLSLEDLAETAHMVDYYDCAEAVEAYSVAWLSYVRSRYKMPRSYGKDLVLWLWISWIFCEPDIFKRITLIAMSECRSEIQTMGLPIPEILINAIESKRQEAVHRIITSINAHLAELLEGTAGCSFACASMHLGFFTKALHVRGLRDPPCAPPYQGISIDMLIQHLREFEYPQWCAGRSLGSGAYCSNHKCIEHWFMTNLATQVEGSVVGLYLEDFPSHGGEGLRTESV